jgi:hypothetical protein
MKPELTFVRGKSSDDFKLFYDCFLCQEPFQYGPHVYMGQPVKAWDIIVCRSCIRGNQDGIVPSTYPHLDAHLEARGAFKRNEKIGWIDWPDGHGLRF